MLTENQIESYHRDGYVKVESLFTNEEAEELGSEMIRVISEWGSESIGWHGPWRDMYLPENERQNTKAVFMHNPHFYSAAWGRVIFHPRLVEAVQSLVGSSVQWHHTVLHAKPPELGTPFPMHQDYPFYPHDGPGFVDCLVHLDDTPLESGCLQVVPGSHKNGPLEHITGSHTAPHLPTDKYHPDFIETVEIPAKVGDVIFFSYYAVHWSNVNRSEEWRRSVRFGYHTPDIYPVGKDRNEPYNNIVAGGFKEKKETNTDLT